MTHSLGLEVWHTFVILLNPALGEIITFIRYPGQTCAHFGSLFIGSDIDGRQMRGKGALSEMAFQMCILKAPLYAKTPVLGSFGPPINTG
jgi:hypothetical protein